MMSFGTFEKDDLTGVINGNFYAVGLQPTLLTLEPAVSRRGRQYYKIFAHSHNTSAEAGAGWPHVSQGQNPKSYIEIKLNSPAFAATFYGKLYPSDIIPNQYRLLWEAPQTLPKPLTITYFAPPVTAGSADPAMT
jgi:uncharacterized protein (DUF736 family)